LHVKLPLLFVLNRSVYEGAAKFIRNLVIGEGSECDPKPRAPCLGILYPQKGTLATDKATRRAVPREAAAGRVVDGPAEC